MTDSEIIKELESKYKTAIDGYYTHLQCGGKGDEHEEKYLEEFGNVLDLINRQKAEIEALKTDNKTLENVIKNAFLQKAGLDINPLAEIKAEAIEECIEKVKAKSGKVIIVNSGIEITDLTNYTISEYDLRNIKKEMVGE